MSDTNHKKYGTDIAVEIVKQLITLASGFIVITGTVINIFFDKTGQGPIIEVFFAAVFSWIFALVSIASGIVALGGIATTTHDSETFDVDEAFTKWGMRSQQVSFLLMFASFVIFASINAVD